MAAFLSKVFSRGKEKEKDRNKDGLKEPASPTSKQNKRTSRASAQSLLEGKFEAVSPSVSPTAQKYEERESVVKKDKEKEKSGLFRPKSRTTSGNGAARKQEDVPQLTLDLNLPSTKIDSKRRDLSVVYEGDSILDDAVLGEKRLSSAEALKLMRACLSVLTSRGLDALGIMHPHWHSASPAMQRKIISLFLSSLAVTPNSSSISSPNSAASAFESELEYVRSPHDVAAVFRWALRHLKLDGDAFDKDNTPSLAWYDNFTEKEKAADYPQAAYGKLLLPVVKPSHAELLDSTLSLVSRLASHSEANGVSGSKLSMFLGHYLLTGNRAENLEDWLSFYSQWERAGRALEHIFLASLRDEESRTGIPKRLSELIVNYPYAKHVVDNQFPRPARFATRAYDALYVRITSESASGTSPRGEIHLPLQVIENALKSDVAGGADDADIVALWEEVRKMSTASEEANSESTVLDKSLANILSDESIRLLALKSDGADKGTPTITMFTPVPEHDALFGTLTANGRARAANGSTSVSRQTSEGTTSSPIAADWTTFSSAGFGETSAGQSLAATLLDNDLEKTEPAKLAARRSLRKKSRSPGRSRAAKTEPPSSFSDARSRFKTAHVSLVKLDESFIDFWSDALLDPISNAWPTFVVCQLKSDAVRMHGDKKVAWLVIEQKFIAPPTEPPSPVRRASSPRPSVRSEGESRPGVVSRVSATFTPRKRFNFFGSQAPASSTVSGAEKRESRSIAKGMKVNELGEVIPEEKDAPSSPVSKAQEAKAPEVKAAPAPEKPKEDKSDAVPVAAALAIGAGATAATTEAAADAIVPEAEESRAPAQEAQPKGPVKEETADVSDKEAEPVPAGAPTLEEVASEEAAASPAVEHEPLAEAHTDETQVAVADAAHDEAAQAAEPEVPASEAPPTAAVSEVAAPVPAAAEFGSAEEPTASVEPPAGETEGAVAGAHHGAGPEPRTEQASLEPHAEPFDAAHSVPETIQEEASELTAAEPVPSADKTDVLPVVSEIGAPGQDAYSTVEESSSSVPVVEEPIVLEETTPLTANNPAVPADESPAPIVEEADERASQVAEEHEEAASPVVEEPAAPIVEPANVAGEQLSTTAAAEETTPIIEEDAASILVEPVTPDVVQAASQVGVEEPSAPVAEEPEDAAAVAPSTGAHVDGPASNAEAEPEAPNSLEELAPTSEEPNSELLTKSTGPDTAEPMEEKAEEAHTGAPSNSSVATA